MTQRKTLKKRIRAVAAETGRNYTSVRAEFNPASSKPSPKDSGDEDRSPMELRLQAGEDGDRLFFRVADVPPEEWFRSRANFERLVGRLLDAVERRHPELLPRISAALALQQRGQREVLDFGMDDWLVLRVDAPLSFAYDIFTHALEETGWMQVDPYEDIYSLRDLPVLWGYLFDNVFHGVADPVRATVRQHWNEAGQHALALRAKECLAALLAADQLLRRHGYEPDNEHYNAEFEENVFEPSDEEWTLVSHGTRGKPREVTLALGRRYLCASSLPIFGRPPREVEVLAFSGKGGPELARVRFIDTGDVLEVETQRLQPLPAAR
jgi:hypothetical protein